MFSKTGNTVDSKVNQALHQGGVENPLQSAMGTGHPSGVNQGLGQGIGQGMNPGMNQGLGQGISQGINQAMHPGMNQGLGQGIGQGMNPGMTQGLGQGIGQGMNPGMNQGLGHGIGQGISQMLPGQMGQSAVNDQTLGHQNLGTMQGMVGQGVSTGLGYHHNTPLPSRAVDPQVHDTGLGHRKPGTTTVAGTGAGVGAGAGAAGKAGKHMITFRPIEARFNHDKDLLGKMDPYCKFKIGFHRGKSAVAKGQGVTPVWNDAVSVKHKAQEFAKLKVKDHDKLRHDDTIGTAKIPLDQVIAAGVVDQWIPVEKGGKVTGEVHLIMEYGMRNAGVSDVNTNTV